MDKHGLKILILVLTAALCLFLTCGSIFGEMFAPSAAFLKTNAADSYTINLGAADTESATGNHSADKIVKIVEVVGKPEQSEPEPSEPEPSKSDVTKIICRYFDNREFMKYINEAASLSVNTSDKPENASKATVKGGIMPHHLVAGRMIASFFQDLAQDAPSTIIILGPNHKLVGVNELHTSTADWDTAFGTLESDSELAKELMDKIKISENNRLMEDEHSISSLVPFIKYYMPDVKIVPLLVHGSYTPEQSKKLGALLAGIVSQRPDTVILSSTDFSHYLDVVNADKMDELTLDAISSFDIDKLSRMNNDHLDSVPCVITLLTVMEKIGADNIEVTGHDNSSRILRSGYDCTTSYYTMFFGSAG